MECGWERDLDQREFLVTVFRQVTEFIENAASAAGDDQAPSDSAMRLIRAIEQNSDRVRVALFAPGSDHRVYACLAGPSFTDAELAVLKGMLPAPDVYCAFDDVHVTLTEGSACTCSIRAFPAIISGAVSCVAAIALRESPQATLQSIDRFPDPCLRLLELVAGNRHLSALSSAQSVEIAELRAAMDIAIPRSALVSLAADIAHELKQPLTAIATYLDALDMKVTQWPVDATDLRDIIRKAAAQARLGDEIIKRANRMAKYKATRRSRGDFHAAIANGMETLARLPAVQDIFFDVRAEGEDGDADFDDTQIQNALAGMVSNALQARIGCADGRLTVLSSVAVDRVELIVSDMEQGACKPGEGRAWEATASGWWAGLETVHRVARAHDGSVTFIDTPVGSGLCRMTFPRWIDQPSEDAP
jgi:hypothetical protein